MMERVFRLSRPTRVVDDSALRESRRTHAPLDVFDERDVLHLKNLVEVPNGFLLEAIRLGCLQEKIVSLQGAIRADRNDVEHNHRAPARIAHQTGIGPQPPY